MKRNVSIILCLLLLSGNCMAFAEGEWVCEACRKDAFGNFCPWCGTPRPPERLICPNCKSIWPLDSSYAFCPDCGVSLALKDAPDTLRLPHTPPTPPVPDTNKTPSVDDFMIGQDNNADSGLESIKSMILAMEEGKNPWVSEKPKSQEAIEAYYEQLAGSSDSGKSKPLSKDAAVGDIVTFGHYEQDNYTDNGKESIEWIVLDAEGDRRLLLSKYALESRTYDRSISKTWKYCELRKWLNDSFLNDAFSLEEQARIPTVTVSAEKNPDYDTWFGESTEDRVFILSLSEVKRYLPSEDARLCERTKYAKRKFTIISSTTDIYSITAWPLRTPGSYGRSVAVVSEDGGINTRGNGLNYKYGIRPALWVDLSPGLQKLPDKKPVPLSQANVGDTVSFGHYFQGQNDADGKSAIEWLVLAKEKNRILVVSKYALDFKPYNIVSTYYVSWETSGLREWLNKDFIDAAFSTEEKAMIPMVTVSVNGYSQPGRTNITWIDTKDQVFVLGDSEAKDYFSGDEARICMPTAYAKSQGVQANDNGSCSWWLRSAGLNSLYADIVDSYGATGGFIQREFSENCAVRPALWIDLSK